MPDAHKSSVGGNGGAAAALTDERLCRLANSAFAGLGGVVLAVSGGPDSTALLLLAQRWREAAGANQNPVIVVATVDHGLRPESAAEADWVARASAKAGFAHHKLLWTGPKPSTGRQAAAREARYGLLADLVRHLALPPPVGIAVGHHLDDQAETVMMRLARGSGLDGLGGMQDRRPLDTARISQTFRHDILVVRPFLGVSKGRLLATLASRGIDWLQDPSNANPDFERVRIRKAMVELEKIGVLPEAVATSARRLRRARDALDRLTDDLASRAVAKNDGAYGRVDLEAFDAAPAELRLRLLQRLIRWYGGGPQPRLDRVEALAEHLAAAGAVSTLGGCQFARTADAITAVREPGRKGLPEMPLTPGTVQIWDGRFSVRAGAGLATPVMVKAVPRQLLSSIARAALQNRTSDVDLPRQAALTLPSFWDGDRLLAVPHPAFAGRLPCHEGLEARFVAA